MINKHKKKIKFLLIGGTAAAVNFIFLFLLYDIIKMQHNWAISIAYLLSLLTHFTGNKFFVFEETGIKRMKLQIFQYAIQVAGYYLLNLLIINLLLLIRVNIYIAAAISMIILMIYSYLVMSRIIFRHKAGKHGR